MYENDYLYAVDRNDDYLAHYGIKGMRWGVRKAIAAGNVAKLSKHYAKAAKKLAKLEKRANSGSKFARRAAALGVAAGVAGGAAALGTRRIGNLINRSAPAVEGAARGVGRGVQSLGLGVARLGQATRNSKIIGLGGNISKVGRKAEGLGNGTIRNAMVGAGTGLKAWGSKSSAVKGLAEGAGKVAGLGGKARGDLARKLMSKGINNDAIGRIGAGALGVGLAGAAGYNAYRAATTKRAARKAAEWRKEMNKAFAGTKYASGAPQKQNHRSRKNRR